MYRKIIIITIVYLYTSPVIGQNFQPELSKSLDSLANSEDKWEVEYIKNKETLYFKEIKNHHLFRAYRILLKDIHPEGIFIINNNSLSSIRILSINNGNVFIKEKFINNYRQSNTTNFIDIGAWDKNYEKKVLNFLIELKKFIKTKKIKQPLEEIKIIIKPTEKNR